MKSCQIKSGPRKGKLKKGYRFGKGGRCVVAKKAPAKKSAKKSASKSKGRCLKWSKGRTRCMKRAK